MLAPCKLIALDPADLVVISAHVQDARVRIGDIIWRQAEKRLVVPLNRRDWDQAVAGGAAPRRLAALRFERGLSCQSRNIDMARPDTQLELIGIDFQPGEAPGGSAMLLFAGGGALRLEVECLECELADLGPDAPGVGDLGAGAAATGLDG